MSKNIKKIIKGIDNLELYFFDLLSEQFTIVEESRMKFLANFPLLIEEQILEINQDYPSLSPILEKDIQISEIKANVINFRIEMLSVDQTDTSINQSKSYYHTLKEIIKSLSSLKLNLGLVRKEIKKRNFSCFDESEINKTDVLKFLNSSMNAFSTSQNVDPVEIEKIIYIYKETIREVEKPKTCWEKVLGHLSILVIATSLYTTVPKIATDLNNVFKSVSVGINLKGTKRGVKEHPFLLEKAEELSM